LGVGPRTSSERAAHQWLDRSGSIVGTVTTGGCCETARLNRTPHVAQAQDGIAGLPKVDWQFTLAIATDDVVRSPKPAP